jgi:hypothetical protein
MASSGSVLDGTQVSPTATRTETAHGSNGHEQGILATRMESSRRPSGEPMLFTDDMPDVDDSIANPNSPADSAAPLAEHGTSDANGWVGWKQTTEVSRVVDDDSLYYRRVREYWSNWTHKEKSRREVVEATWWRP